MWPVQQVPRLPRNVPPTLSALDTGVSLTGAPNATFKRSKTDQGLKVHMGRTQLELDLLRSKISASKEKLGTMPQTPPSSSSASSLKTSLVFQLVGILVSLGIEPMCQADRGCSGRFGPRLCGRGDCGLLLVLGCLLLWSAYLSIFMHTSLSHHMCYHLSC